jgi:DUF1009 family protein
MSAEKIALILGSGQIAIDAFHHLRDRNKDVYTILLENSNLSFHDLEISKEKSLMTRPEKLGKIFSYLKENNVTKLVMIGALKRPALLSLRPDFKTLKLLLKSLETFLRGGDDLLLRTLKNEAQNYGITVLGLHQLWPEIIASEHDTVNIKLYEPYRALSVKAWRAAKIHGQKDKGQSVCAFPNDGIHAETRQGTDHLIKTSADIDGIGGILVKTSKPQQDLSLDMPTIGLATFQNLVKYGYKGAVIETNKTILHDKEAVRRYCIEHDLFLVVKVNEDMAE